MAALMFKVGSLALRTLSKPLGERFQRWVLSHPTARGHVIRVAQSLHRLEVYISRGAEGKTGKAFIGDLTEEASVQLASKIASEGFVFTIGVAILLVEYDRQARKENKKKVLEQQERKALIDRARSERQRLYDENEQQQVMLKSISERLNTFEAMLNKLQEDVRVQAQQLEKRRGWTVFGSG